MDPVTLLSPTGILGSGFSDASLARGREFPVDLIACDGGSTDPGPYYLGSGNTLFSEAAVERDLDRLVDLTLDLGVPLVIGSFGTAGRDDQVEAGVRLLDRLLARRGETADVAVVLCDQSAERLKGWRDRISRPPGGGAASLDGHTVAVMGHEPINAALARGAQIVLAGRSSDAALFAALPIARGHDPAAAWHLGKVLECGAAAATNRSAPDGMLGGLDGDGFWVEPLSAQLSCSPSSVATHSLYENPDPFRFLEPGGAVDISEATYSAVDERRVRVRGSTFAPAEEYTVKLESARFVGYQSVAIAGLGDPVHLGQIDGWLAGGLDAVRRRAGELFPEQLIDLRATVYGGGAVQGPAAGVAPRDQAALVIEYTAASQEAADGIASVGTHLLLHWPVPQYQGSVTLLALRHSPPVLRRGAVYEFGRPALLRLDDPLEPFRLTVRTLGAAHGR